MVDLNIQEMTILFGVGGDVLLRDAELVLMTLFLLELDLCLDWEGEKKITWYTCGWIIYITK